jgi:hypothetical protein
VVECFNISEACTFSILRVTNCVVQVDAEIVGRMGCVQNMEVRRGNCLYQVNGSSAIQEQPIPGPTVAPHGLFLEF